MLDALLFFLVALLYSSVGHAGASGYLALMALLGTSAVVMRPTALVLNLFVAAIGTVAFVRAGHFRWSLTWPFLVTAVPMAYLGGRLALPVESYRTVVGVVLLLSAARLLVELRATDRALRAPPIGAAAAVGAGLGFLAGITGVGGGIFLSPLLLLAGWADLRTTAATSVVFILANSAAGLLGQWHAVGNLPAEALPWGAAVVCGGLVGSWLGARRLPAPAIRATLAAVLVTAGIKLIA